MKHIVTQFLLPVKQVAEGDFLMTIAEYKALPKAEQKLYQSYRTCPTCGEKLLRTSHSTGDLHVQCLTCETCPDCDDGE